MQYAVFLPNFNIFSDPKTLVKLAQDAEAAGWDGFFIWDHIARSWVVDTVDPWIALAAIAASTERIKLGAMVTPLARRRPWKVARETVTLDHLSDGRLIFGVGLGGASGAEAEWGNFGEAMDFKERAKITDEALDIMTGLWSGQPFAYEGEVFTVKESQFTPPPVQTPRIPIWAAGYWDNKAPFRRAARWDGAFPLIKVGLDEVASIRAVRDFIASLREDDTPFDIVHCGNRTPTPADDPARGAEIVAPFAEAGATWWFEPISPLAFGISWEKTWDMERMSARILGGPPKV